MFRGLTHNYNQTNYRLTSVVEASTGIKVRDFSQTDSYDERGNIKKNGNTDSLNSFNYNLANQMTHAGRSNSYVYDGFNRRIKSVKGNKTEYSMYSQSGKLLYRESDQSLLTTYS